MRAAKVRLKLPVAVQALRWWVPNWEPSTRQVAVVRVPGILTRDLPLKRAASVPKESEPLTTGLPMRPIECSERILFGETLSLQAHREAVQLPVQWNEFPLAHEAVLPDSRRNQ